MSYLPWFLRFISLYWVIYRFCYLLIHWMSLRWTIKTLRTVNKSKTCRMHCFPYTYYCRPIRSCNDNCFVLCDFITTPVILYWKDMAHLLENGRRNNVLQYVLPWKPIDGGDTLPRVLFSQFLGIRLFVACNERLKLQI